MFYRYIKVMPEGIQHGFVISGRLITQMDCIIYLELESADLLGVFSQGNYYPNKVYTHPLDHMPSDKWVVYF